eukprot:TRINITY_DN365_c0_g3_i4.p1 TRINITY_DN365_c0_g3~~TRINITY_DN365_c0_g3_i4.p1  ORF type:complete len:132 (+),score=9.10 TRINITY_DN365_c0_g3_i4:312-707(+)
MVISTSSALSEPSNDNNSTSSTSSTNNISQSCMSDTNVDETNNYQRDDYKINLWDKQYQFDTNSILSTCLCFTCTHHTRAYLHHLLNTHEMLATILLSMHNHQHYFAFFRSVREHITNQTFHKFRQKFVKK